MISAAHYALLGDVVAAFPDRDIVVIGATALAWHFGASFRGTLDLDLCVAIDLEEHGRATGIPSAWIRLPGMPHRWRLPDGQLVDILPAAAGLLATGVITWADGTELDLTGIDLAMQDGSPCSTELPAIVRVASRRALFVTKIVAWLDRPTERTKDLGDIAHLLDNYVGAEDSRLWDEPGLDPEREFDERPAWLLGMDLRAVCSDRHRTRIHEFTERVVDEDRREHHWLMQASPVSWRGDSAEFRRRVSALLDGLG